MSRESRREVVEREDVDGIRFYDNKLSDLVPENEGGLGSEESGGSSGPFSTSSPTRPLPSPGKKVFDQVIRDNLRLSRAPGGKDEELPSQYAPARHRLHEGANILATRTQTAAARPEAGAGAAATPQPEPGDQTKGGSTPWNEITVAYQGTVSTLLACRAGRMPICSRSGSG